MKIGRINIVTDSWEGSPETARIVLEQVFEQKKGGKLDLLMTPAGFLWAKMENGKIEMPSLNRQKEKVFELLKKEAKKEVNRFLCENGFPEKLKKRTRHIALGIDVGLPIKNRFKKGKGKEKFCNGKSGIHAEFVVVIDLNNLGVKDCWWTGKSYPASGQENNLYRFTNMKSHCKDIDTLGKTIILVCHDLNIYHPRGYGLEKKGKLKEWRLNIRESFRPLVEEFNPNLLLHLYHSGQSPRTWTHTWNRLKKKVGSINSYVGCGIICRKAIKEKINEKKKGNSETVDDVIEKIKEKTKTKKEGLTVVDFDIKN